MGAFGGTHHFRLARYGKLWSGFVVSSSFAQAAGSVSWKRALAGQGIRWALLTAVMLGVPEAVWLMRGHQIQTLLEEYEEPASVSKDPVVFGACTMSFLGYSLTEKADPAHPLEQRMAVYESALEDARAEVESIATAGARYIRVGASGDHLLEPHADQEILDDRFMKVVHQTHIPLVLVDTQHPKSTRKRKLTWQEFCSFQYDRIAYYQNRYQPEVYLIVCEPLSYHQFVLNRASPFDPAAWTEQLTKVARMVKSIDPQTRTGICLLVSPEKTAEWKVWKQMQNLPELDILAVEIYAPEQFRQTEDRLGEFGHPAGGSSGSARGTRGDPPPPMRSGPLLATTWRLVKMRSMSRAHGVSRAAGLIGNPHARANSS